MNTPHTNNTWVDRVLQSSGDKRLDLILTRPVVAWFSNQCLAVHRLIKISASLREDLWIIIQGRVDEKHRELLSTVSPCPLDVCLEWPDRESDWVLCEFPDEISFCEAELKYFKQ